MTKPRTVAVVAPRMLQVGGLQSYAWRVAHWLRDSPDHDVVVISTHPGRGVRREERDGIQVVLLGTWLTLSNTPISPWWYLQLRRLFRRLRIDVVNAHAPVPYLADMAILAAGRRRSVLSYHAGSMVKGDGRGVVDRLLRLYERVVLPRVMARADELIAASPTALVAQDARAVVITPGVDLSVFGPVTGEEAPARWRSVTYVGVLKHTSAWKGVHILLEAAARVPDLHVEMVGDGDAREDLAARAQRLGIADRVTWHGELAPTAVAGVLRRTGALVLPSLTDAESFGMVLVEAMAAGTPVIGSDVGGIPHVIRDGVDGLVVPPGDVPALAAAIRSVLDDPALATRLGAAGVEAARGRWSWEHQRSTTLRVLDGPSQPAAAASPGPRPVRLAVLTDAVTPWHTGGKEQRQQELWPRMAAQGMQVDVYTMQWWDGPRSIVRDGVTYHALMPLIPLYTAGGRRSITQAVGFALATLRMLTKRFDVLEVDAIPFLQLFPARVVSWIRRRPMVVTWHEFWGRDYWVRYLGPLGHLAAFVEQSAARLPDTILAVSEGTAERVSAVGGRRLALVTPGIAMQGLPAVPQRVAADHVRLLCAGRLLDHKRVDVAIDACAALVARGIPARLRVIGAGPAAADLQAHAERVAPGLVEFEAFLPAHADVLTAMAAADVVLFPSEREGFGMVALEAMAMGTPVITSDHVDNFARHLVLDRTSGRVCPNRPDAIADAVVEVIAERERYAEGALALAGRYDWDLIAVQASAAYRAVTPVAG